MELGCFQSSGMAGGWDRECRLFLFKREEGKKEGIIPTFFLSLHTCDPTASHPSYFLCGCMCVLFMNVTLLGSQTLFMIDESWLDLDLCHGPGMFRHVLGEKCHQYVADRCV